MRLTMRTTRLCTQRRPNRHHLCHRIQQHLHLPRMQEWAAWTQIPEQRHRSFCQPPSFIGMVPASSVSGRSGYVTTKPLCYCELVPPPYPPMLHGGVIWHLHCSCEVLRRLPPNLPVPSLTLCVAPKASPADSWSRRGVQWRSTLLGLPWVLFSGYAVCVDWYVHTYLLDPFPSAWLTFLVNSPNVPPFNAYCWREHF